MPAFKLKLADNPSLELIWTNDLLPIIVQAAAVSHQRAASRGGDDLSKRGDAILSWHRYVEKPKRKSLQRGLTMSS